MDPVTLIVIASMNGRPLIMQREVPAARCEARAPAATHFRRAACAEPQS